MILVIDNYDSFTYNLVQYLGELGAVVEVHRNDAIDVPGIFAREPEGVLISPGPGAPPEAGVTIEAIRQCAGKIPVFGVCLGHQAMGEVFGAKVVRAPRLMHGRTSAIEHNNTGVFRGLPSPFTATRYHSLIVERSTIGPDIEVTAWTAEGEVIGHAPSASRRRRRPVSSGVVPDRARPCAAQELPGAVAGARPPRVQAGRVMREALEELVQGRELSAAAMEAAIESLFTGAATPAQIAALLIALRMKGETAGELAAAARVMRRHALPVKTSGQGPLLDTCGTGGDGSGSFNVSTAAAIVVAACGVRVAKHGNRAASVQVG